MYSDRRTTRAGLDNGGHMSQIGTVATETSAASRAFRRSMTVSAVRCTLTYLVFPFLLPALGLVSDAGVAVGMAVAVVAIGADITAIRRLFAVHHKWRWHFTGLATLVVCALLVLVVGDVVTLAS